MHKQLRAIAFYLPQYHPIPENDAWWGKGFTEWTNVTKARPLFPGHYQPHLPADLGFYDLRLNETQTAQAALAQQYGIYGFCYYHYWFSGKLMLQQPLQQMLNSGKPDFPFMICWANENWTRTWDGLDKELLISQQYSPEDDAAHFAYLLPILQDPRYIRINGKPVLAIYRSTQLPDPARTFATWRSLAAEAGMELYITRVESHAEAGDQYMVRGVDAAIGFEPFTPACKLLQKQLDKQQLSKQFTKQYVRFKLASKPKQQAIRKRVTDRIPYALFVENSISQRQQTTYRRYPCVTPMWDNTARKGEKGFLLTGSTPALYQRWLAWEIDHFEPYSKEENLVFINAWNEWAEGNHLEPCQKWQHQYLEATKMALQQNHS